MILIAVVAFPFNASKILALPVVFFSTFCAILEKTGPCVLYFILFAANLNNSDSLVYVEPPVAIPTKL